MPGVREPVVRHLWVVVLLVLATACGRGTGAASHKVVHVSLGDEGCSPETVSIRAGQTSFVVTNPRSSRVTTFELRRDQVSLGRLENVLGGLTRELRLTLEPGSYAMLCTGGGIGGTGAVLVAAQDAAPEFEDSFAGSPGPPHQTATP